MSVPEYKSSFSWHDIHFSTLYLFLNHSVLQCFYVFICACDDQHALLCLNDLCLLSFQFYIENLVLSVGKLPENLRVFARIFYIFSGSSFRTSLFESLCCRKVKAVGHLHSATFLENVNSSWKEHFSSPLTHFRAQMHPRCKSMITLALHAVARYIHFYLHISTGHQLKELRIMPTIKSHS